MDIIFFVLFAIFGIVFFSLIIFLGLNATKIKGWLGEKTISIRLEKLDISKYVILNDIFIKNEKGTTSQIDHLVVSVYGIFVIETKNYKGWIFGNEKAENWSQIIYKQKNFFRNPVKQNWSHVYALKSLLKDYKDIRYIPVVVFAGSAVLKQIVSNVPVIYDYEIKNFIQEYPVERCISFEDVKQIVSILENANIKDKEIRKKHVNNIHKTVIERQLKMENLICPRCNSELKLRNGRNGKFYGCSNYPRCRFTMSY
ncbi:MAG: hypothetical protein GX220_03415 [Treponema sp.]|jgi:hypothetical protein|nr:hypothetical protein [Treponema sp.]